MWMQSLLVSLLLAVLGYILYRRVRPGFADVL
jgi:ABC-type polysaccharide/polyol phosphate export permease